MRFRPWLLVVTALYACFIAWMTLRTSVYGSGASHLLWRALDVFARHSSTDWLTFGVVEGLANVAMFVPFGFFLALFFPRRLWIASALLCVLASYGIESFQGAALPSRVEDVGDIVHNGLGGLIGALLATLLRMVTAPRGRRNGRRLLTS
jgi:glycopeptide antibiotics resistance protein